MLCSGTAGIVFFRSVSKTRAHSPSTVKQYPPSPMKQRASVSTHPESAKKKAEREKGDGAAAQDRRAEEARGTEKPDRKMTKSESSDIGASGRWRHTYCAGLTDGNISILVARGT